MEIELQDYRMHYEISGDPEGEPLLWLHGWSGTGQDWKYIFKEAPAGFRVIEPDLRGHGSSSGFHGVMSFRQLALDIFALLDHLGIPRLKAMGLSGGGIVLLHMATLDSGRIDSMILISASPYFPEEVRVVQRRFSLTTLSESELKSMRERCGSGPEQLDWVIEQAHNMAATYDDVNFTPPLLGTITARTLIVAGDRDPLSPARLAFEMRSAIPRSALWVVPNAGHGPVFGPSAARFAETAAAFLRGDWPNP